MRTVSVYFDASVIVPMFIEDAFNERVDAFVRLTAPVVTVSNFAMAEVALALNLRVRAKLLRAEDARQALGELDIWRAETASVCPVERTDIAAAESFLRRLDLPLRAPDAIHIAIAQRLNLELATFDARMADCASRLGVNLAAT
jgi:predicted nucleic acid-binding protein